ncbi:MAG: ATP-dependent dethiobiotin synthetase BioD [Muribaculaceae bacterium]|nr:ATP-dependent dethiobiotin synthetase BioD [Muribaculaceae bacterium]
MSEVIFVSGIDTDAGKTYATGLLARNLMEEGKKVATLKFIQTGCEGSSEDIEMHRKIMGIRLPEDEDATTFPVMFKYPASAQLAARLEGREIDLESIDRAIGKLGRNYDVVLVEGAGGLMVPLSDDFFSIDFPKSRGLPVILVTNGVLGSINHTILSLEALKSRGIKLHSVVYNHHFDSDPVIAEDTRGFIRRYVNKNWPGVPIIDLPSI